MVKSQIEQGSINNQLKDTYSLVEVDELSYGLLLKRYCKVTNNIEFYNKLLVLKDYRNFLAHKSLLAVSNMSPELKKFIGAYHQVVFDYQALSREVDECILLFSKLHSKS